MIYSAMFFTLKFTEVTDYAAVDQSLDFNPEVPLIEVPVSIVSNDMIEPTENFFAVLNVTSQDSGNIVLGRNIAQITIEDDDCKQIHCLHVTGVITIIYPHFTCAHTLYSCHNWDSGGECGCERRW